MADTPKAPSLCEGCRRDPAAGVDRMGDPICQPCIDRMVAVGRKP